MKTISEWHQYWKENLVREAQKNRFPDLFTKSKDVSEIIKKSYENLKPTYFYNNEIPEKFSY